MFFLRNEKILLSHVGRSIGLKPTKLFAALSIYKTSIPIVTNMKMNAYLYTYDTCEQLK